MKYIYLKDFGIYKKGYVLTINPIYMLHALKDKIVSEFNGETEHITVNVPVEIPKKKKSGRPAKSTTVKKNKK